MIAGALELLVSFTLLTLLVLAVRRPIAQLVGAEWAYALWLLPVVLPFLPPIPLLASTAPAFTVVLPSVPMDAAPQAAARESGAWLQWLLALWAGGAAVFAIWQQSTYSAFMLHLGRDGRRADPPVYGGIKVIESEAVEGPVAVGVINRRIVVPLDFASRYTPAERRLALEHELVHHRRLDILWNWLGLSIVTANWFNPVAHIAFRAFRSDQELACDAAVTRRAPAARHDYACALIKAASFPGVLAACPLNRADFLKRRLKMMKQHRSSRARTLGGVASLCLIGGAGLAFGGPGFIHEEQAPAALAASAVAQPAALEAAGISTLRDKCGATGREIVCSNEEAKAPAVKAIVARSASRAEGGQEPAPRRARQALEAEPNAEKAANPEEMAEAQALHDAARMAGLEAADRVEGLARVRESHARVHARAAVIAHRHERVLAALDPLASSRVLMVSMRDPFSAEIDAAIAEARRGVSEARAVGALRMVRFEVERELKVLEHHH